MQIENEKYRFLKEAKTYISKSFNSVKALEIKDQKSWIQKFGSNYLEDQYKEFSILMQEVERESKILEYGSAPFIFTKALDLAGYHVWGTDISPERFSNLEKLGLNINKIDLDREPLPFEDDQFDVIICNEIFEHLRNDLIFTFSEAYRVLKKNGKMIIGTPNVRSLKGLFKYLVKGINYSTVDSLYQEWFKLGQYGHMGHVREYTHKEIETFMENIGFTPIKVIYKKSPKIKSINTNIITYIKPSLKSYMSLIFIKK